MLHDRSDSAVSICDRLSAAIEVVAPAMSGVARITGQLATGATGSPNKGAGHSAG
jgi:hypothetical protein